MKYTVAFRRPPINKYPNQKQVAAMEGSMKGRCDKREARGKHNTIILGVL